MSVYGRSPLPSAPRYRAGLSPSLDGPTIRPASFVAFGRLLAHVCLYTLARLLPRRLAIEPACRPPWMARRSGAITSLPSVVCSLRMSLYGLLVLRLTLVQRIGLVLQN